MSIEAQGSASLSWVCRCSSGLRSASSPVIHILAGEKVCIQAITPRQSGSALASSITRRMAAGVGEHRLPDDLGRHPAGRGQRALDLRDWAATWSSASGP